jgi:PAT family beta-lactamase induction signal transducer AmpG
MLALTEKEQSFFVGIRSTFYRVAMITGQGLLVMLAGYFEEHPMTLTDNAVSSAWSVTFFVLAGLFLAFFLYHRFVLPYPVIDRPAGAGTGDVTREFVATFKSFFHKPAVGLMLAFLLLYRFAEAQLVKLAQPFMLDGREVGGLALSTAEVGFVYGTVGVVALTLGGLLGGFVASRNGLKYWLWWMLLAINLPDAVYVYLSYTQPENLLIVNVCVAIEQLGYGFGFTAYLLYMIYVSQGTYQTAHYALCTGFMALGMMIPGMFSGWLQEQIGYQSFFLWVMTATIPGFIVARFVTIDPEFGKKAEKAG